MTQRLTSRPYTRVGGTSGGIFPVGVISGELPMGGGYLRLPTTYGTGVHRIVLFSHYVRVGRYQ